jgi:GTP pyrophosphokinase
VTSERALLEAYQARFPLLQSLAKDLERETSETLHGVGHVDRVSFRAKAANKFVIKATDKRKKYTDPLVEIEDQIGGRVLVFFLDDIDIVIRRLKGLFNEIEDERRGPGSGWEFGYESHHLVCMLPRHLLPPEWAAQDSMPKTFELQVRTLFMHAWAEPQHDLGYKGPDDMPRSVQRQWAWAAAAASNGDHMINAASKWTPANGPQRQEGQADAGAVAEPPPERRRERREADEEPV